jgi:hypothetical protein
VSDDSYTWDWAKLHIEYDRLRKALEGAIDMIDKGLPNVAYRVLHRALSGGEGEITADGVIKFFREMPDEPREAEGREGKED